MKRTQERENGEVQTAKNSPSVGKHEPERKHRYIKHQARWNEVAVLSWPKSTEIGPCIYEMEASNNYM